MNYTIQLIPLKAFLLLLCFASLGFNIPYLFVLFVICYLLFDILSFKRKEFNVGAPIILVLSLFFYASVYLFFDEYTSLDNYTQWTYFFMCSFGSFAIFLLMGQTLVDAKKVIAPVFMFFVFFRVLIAVVYSYIVGADLYGYSLILDPIRGYETNSPGYSNAIAISTSYFILSLFFDELSKRLKMVYLSIILISFLCAIFLAGRTFFIIITLACILGGVVKGVNKRLIFIVGVLTPVLFYFLFEGEHFNFMLNRFLDSGLESNRFEHYKDAITKVLDYPLGGFSINQSIEQTQWFHNLWFDVAKISGFLSLIPLLFINIILMITNRYRDGNESFFFMSFICLLILAQDVVMEGAILNYIIYIFFGCGGLYLDKSYSLEGHLYSI